MDSAPAGHLKPERRPPPSPWSPLKIRFFRGLWFATLVSNAGSWMHELGAGWLMTSLSPSPVMVALVQTAVSLPVFMLAIPSGALADILDRRRYLISVQIWMMLVAVVLGILTISGITNAWILLALTFCLGIGTAMMMPAWAAVTPEVVPREELQRAVALNAMGMNAARAIGPAIAGIIIAVAGNGAVFLINAVTFLFVIRVLLRWQRPPASDLGHPAERFLSAVKTGLRYAGNSPALQATLIRSFGFFLFASALWALLPLVAKQLIGGGPQVFGILVATVGAGAVSGGILLPRLHARCNSDQLIIAASVLVSVSMTVIAFVHQLYICIIVMAVFGMAWITIVSSLSVAAQLALPDWVRSRGMAIYITTFLGTMAIGSLLWGQLAEWTGIPAALAMAAAGGILAIRFTRRWSISVNEHIDLTPSMHWELPVTHDRVTHDRAPVMVIIHYPVSPGREQEFMQTIQKLARFRKRDGAYAWGVLEDARKPGHFIEYYQVESWLEHLRQHRRVTNDVRLIQEQLRACLAGGGGPEVTHFVGPSGRDSNHAKM